MARPKRRVAAIRPRLEHLERRECPAVDVVQRGVFLYLTGDAADDWVAVCDEGGNLVEVQTPDDTQLYRGVKWVVGNLAEGDDTFEFHQAATNPSNYFVGKLDLGAGADQFLYRTPPAENDPPEPDRSATYSLDIRAGTGNDVMNIAAGYRPGLDLDLRFDVGAGDDQVEASYKRDPATPVGANLPRWSLDIATGEGKDDLRITFNDPGNDELMPLAQLQTGIHGFGGDTSAVLDYANVAVTGGLTEVVALGDGENSYASTLSNVTVGGLLKQSVTGGDGGDEVGIIIIGGRIGAVTQKANVGEGDDIVSLSWKRSEVLGPVGTRLILGDGNDHGVITVEENAHFAGSVKWAVDTGGDDDSATMVFQDSEDFTALEGPLTLRLGLGAGDDTGNVVLRDANDVAGPLTVVVDGGTGDDGIVASVDFVPRTGGTDPAPRPSSCGGCVRVSVLVDLRGGDGLDTIDASTEGAWRGIARFLLRGGNDDDALGFDGVIGDGSTGKLAVDMQGGAGGDVLGTDLLIPVEQVVPIYMRLLGGLGDDVESLVASGPGEEGPQPHLFVLDGGPGFDLAQAPPGAVVRNCEGEI